VFSSQILGTGSYLPKRILTNEDLETMVETDHEWIMDRTGIKSRHLAAKGEVTTDMAYQAAENAMAAAKITSGDIDAILFATVTPDQVMPSAACVLQSKLKCREIMSVDMSAACSGFLYSLSTADQFIKSGAFKNILVIGAEVLSSIINYKDRSTCILFGDGAGAVVLGRAPENSPSKILGFHLGADGSVGDALTLPGGGSKFPTSIETVQDGLHFVHMNGREIFKHAVRAMTKSSQKVLEAANVKASDVRWMIPHQANVRIIESVGSQLGITLDRVIMNIEETGNTSSASIPIAFDEAIRDGRIQRGDIILQTAFGGGLTYGSVLFKY
jgi:3-oxoacyl-[acyl-carrier-protein] synthase III